MMVVRLSALRTGRKANNFTTILRLEGIDSIKKKQNSATFKKGRTLHLNVISG
jgi:hypothetical protein